MHALVISGGGAKLWYGAGALSALKSQGMVYDQVYGTSTGAICTLLWMQGNPSKAWDMAETIKPTDFIKAPSNLIKLHRFAQGRNIADNSPMLKSLQTIFPRHTLNFSFDSFVIATNLITQKRKVFKLTNKDPDLYRYVIASGSIPTLFEPVEFNSDLVCVDGSAIDNTLLDPAIEAGCNEITLIILTEKDTYNCNPKNMFDVINSLTEGTLASSAVKDLKLCAARNHIKGYKKIKVNLIRPQRRIPVELFKWNCDQARTAFDMGYTDALGMETIIDPENLDPAPEGAKF